MLNAIAKKRMAAFGRKGNYDTSYLADIIDGAGAGAAVTATKRAARSCSVGACAHSYRSRMPSSPPGFVLFDDKGVVHVLALDVVDGKIGAIYAIRNPDKLRGIKERFFA